MNRIVDLITSVPPTVWGFIVGSLITVLGVLLTNISNTGRLRLQHAHERELEAVERDLSMRRDVYLEAIEAISAALVAVGRLVDFSVPYTELMEMYTSRSPAIAKVNVIANDETIKAVNLFTQELTGVFLRLTTKRQQLDLIQERIRGLESEIAALSSEQELAQAEIRAHEDAAGQDAKPLASLRATYERRQGQLAALRQEQEALDSQLFPAMIQLVQESAAEHTMLDRLLAPVIGLMRAELGLPFDEAFYTRILEESHEKQNEYLSQILQEISALLGENLEQAG